MSTHAPTRPPHSPTRHTVTGSIIITIDGPAGTGKSTAAADLARRLGLDVLDTGAMYRAAALVALRQGVDLEDGPAIAAAVREAELFFDWTLDPPAICRRRPTPKNLAADIRTREANAAVAAVSHHPELRAVLVSEQRRIHREHPRLVTEGRDQGSVVFPDAPIKFYLDATPEIRAQRRADQAARLGQQVDLQQVLREINRRDELDRSRQDGPLVIPQDAIRIDTSDLTLSEVVDCLEAHVRRLTADRGDGGDA